MKLVYSDATRDACERADYNVPMALTQNSFSNCKNRGWLLVPLISRDIWWMSRLCCVPLWLPASNAADRFKCINLGTFTLSLWQCVEDARGWQQCCWIPMDCPMGCPMDCYTVTLCFLILVNVYYCHIGMAGFSGHLLTSSLFTGLHATLIMLETQGLTRPDYSML